RASHASAEYSLNGVSSEKPCALPSFFNPASYRAMTLAFFHGSSPPLASDRPLFGASRFGSKYSTAPMPEQRGHAPCGLLNENNCGESPDRLILQVGHTDPVECTVSSVSPTAVITATASCPAPYFRASSTQSASLPRNPSFITSRSPPSS